MRRYLLHKTLVSAVTVWALWLGVSPGRAVAMPSESVSTFQQATVRDAQIESILRVAARPEAQVRLRLAGINPAELQGRLATLNDTQLAMVAEQADAVQAGGILGVIIALLVIAILIVILVVLLDDKEIDVDVKDKKG